MCVCVVCEYGVWVWVWCGVGVYGRDRDSRSRRAVGKMLLCLLSQPRDMACRRRPMHLPPGIDDLKAILL